MRALPLNSRTRQLPTIATPGAWAHLCVSFARIHAPPCAGCLLLPLRRTIFDNDTVSAFSNSAIFVVAIMLSGVLEDYKEAESMVRGRAWSYQDRAPAAPPPSRARVHLHHSCAPRRRFARSPVS